MAYKFDYKKELKIYKVIWKNGKTKRSVLF